MLDSRTLEEDLPFTCERCGYTFGRWLKECIDLGVKCPKCRFKLDMTETELIDVANMIQACHDAQDLSREDGDDDV